ncbi:MAG: PIG-L deacetylase family protein [Limnochordia bacterium]|jgi:LmbE family N-acetylglucosaminyl deacetylase
MKRMARVLIIIVVVLTILTVPVFAVENQGGAGEKVVIWYLPHPDDETIGMAGAIINSVRAGNRNIFVYLTKGGNTLARFPTFVKGKILAPPKDVKSARMREARAALAILGAAPDDIVFYDFPDGQLRYNQVLSVIESFYATYPDAALHTVSIHDTHPDHKVTAAAVTVFINQLENKPDVRFYRVYTYLLEADKRGGPGVIAEPVPDIELKRAAMAVYQEYDPVKGHYAVGSRSAPRLFQSAGDDMYEYRDVGPGEVTGFGPPYIMVEPLSISTGVEYASAAYPWRVTIMNETVQQPQLMVQLDYRLMNVMASGRLYAGGAVRLIDQSLTSYVLVGISAFDTFYTEYWRRLLGNGYDGMRMGLRLAFW